MRLPFISNKTIHEFLLASALAFGLVQTATVIAADFSSLSNQDASSGVRVTLEKGAQGALSKLGVTDGFLNNPKVKIPLPPFIEQSRGALKMLGKGKEADELEVSINRAAEAAVPQAKELLSKAIKSMTVEDAKKILAGGDDSVTQFFKSKTESNLTAQFLPIVKKTTDKSGLAQKYNGFADQGAKLGLIKGDQTKVENYVTQKALDGLYLMIGEEEKAIRQDPVKAGSDILKKVFGK